MRFLPSTVIAIVPCRSPPPTRQKSFGICEMHHRPIAASRAIISARAHPVCPRSSNLKPRLARGSFFYRPQSSPASRFTAAQAGFFDLSQLGVAARADHDHASAAVLKRVLHKLSAPVWSLPLALAFGALWQVPTRPASHNSGRVFARV